MTDLFPLFNNALIKHQSEPVSIRQFRLQDVSEFMKEAYRINRLISELHAYLKTIRQSYLSITQPPRRKQPPRDVTTSAQSLPGADVKYLTDAQRTQIDAEAKQLLRELNAAVQRLSDAEQVRQSTESTVALKKRARQGLGALGRWAAGGGLTAKSPEEELQEAKANTIKVHREGVIWYLQQKLQECGSFQGSMMEIRLSREVEKSKSVLYKARSSVLPPELVVDSERYGRTPGSGSSMQASGDRPNTQTLRIEDMEAEGPEQRLSPEQMQLFKQENQDLLKHYENTLDQVRATEQSLLEISELQTTLANNLAVQSAHIDQLVEDSQMTTENVGRGNKELKKASERRSTAQMVFYGTSIICFTLVIWDWFI